MCTVNEKQQQKQKPIEGVESVRELFEKNANAETGAKYKRSNVRMFIYL